MTHDELLAKIGNPVDEGYQYGDIVFNKALRAVVELHTPVYVKEMNGNTRSKCEECTNWDMGITEQDLVEIAYPCPTIETIEKELA